MWTLSPEQRGRAEGGSRRASWNDPCAEAEFCVLWLFTGRSFLRGLQEESRWVAKAAVGL